MIRGEKGMAVEVTMPKLGLTMDEGKIVAWLKKDQEEVKEGELLLEVETDKALNQVESPASGYLQILKKEGETAKVGEIIAYLFEAGEEAPAGKGEDNKENKGERAVEKSGTSPGALETTGGVITTVPSGIIKATPAARRLARELKVNLAEVKPSHPHGVISINDVQTYVQAMTVGEKKEPRPNEEQGMPLEGLRKVIAVRMTESQTIPRVILSSEVNMENVIRRYEKFKSNGQKVSYTAFFIKATALALGKHPEINAVFDGEKLKKEKEINIGVAVDTPKGLVVPVIHGVMEKTIVEINEELSLLARLARAGRLRKEQLAGGSFTVTNLGMYPVDFFTPMLNPPEVAILGIGRMALKPVALNEYTVAIQYRCVLNLAIDHRVVDGAPGARFLQTLIEILEKDDYEQKG